MTDEQFMQAAIEMALAGVEAGQTPFGAVIARDGAVVARAHNRVWATTDPTAHAEVVAIREAAASLRSIDLTGCTIYSTCEPCPMCFAACHWARIGKIIFGASIADAREAGFNELAISNQDLKILGHSGVQIVPGFMPHAAQEPFRRFAARGGRVY